MEDNLMDQLGAENENEAQEFLELVAQLGFAGELQRPSEGLKARLMASIAVPEGLHVLRQSEGTWKQTPFAGVSYKSLFVDRETSMHTLLLKLEPGACYPRHRHKRPEQCLVLRGEVDIDSKLRIEAGDFEWADGETIHDSISSKTGCELLIISSLHDEVLI